MKLTNLLTVSALATAMVAPVAMADTTTISPEQKKQFETIIHDYLVTNPEVLMEASQVLQAKQQASQQKEAKTAITQNIAQLVSGQLAVDGNPKGNVTVVEFFDYQCGHCKQMKPVIAEALKKNTNLRVVYKEFPIFGKTSDAAAKAALAAGMQGKYLAMHDALLQNEKNITPEIIDETAKSLGLDMKKFKVDMDSKAISDELDANRKLAEQMHLMGTPAFVVLATPGGNFKAGSETHFIPGGTSVDVLQGMIDKAAATK